MRFTKDRFSIPGAVFQDDLSHSELLVLIYLFSASSVDGIASPGYDAIMQAIGMERRTVAKALRQLQRKGWFQFQQKGGPKKALYYLRIPPRLLGMDIKLMPGKIVRL